VHQQVCVTGATSQIGVFLLPRLRAAGHAVLALSRRAPRPAGAPGDGPDGGSAEGSAQGLAWIHPDDLPDEARPPGIETLVSCGPLELAARLVDSLPSLRRVVAFSSSSVLSKAESRDAGERTAMADMAASERVLGEACARRGLPLLLLRPTLIYGCGLDRNVSLLAAIAHRFGLIPLAGRARGLRQPVHADDLAALTLLALEDPTPPGFVSPACGGDTISYREMCTRIARAVPRRVRLLSFPESVLAGAVRAMAIYPRWQGLSPEMVHRQNRDLVFDDSRLRNALNWTPRPFAPSPNDFDLPPEARSLQPFL
jgi:nucleoside-diphosphate-sugar epimerase